MKAIIILIIATVIITVVNLVIGLLNKTRDFESFVSLKNKVGIVPISLSLLGTIIGGGMFFSVGEMGFESGVAPVSIALSYIIGFLLLSIMLNKIKSLTAPKDVNTIYDIIEKKLDG